MLGSKCGGDALIDARLAAPYDSFGRLAIVPNAESRGMVLDQLAYRTARSYVRNFSGEYDELGARRLKAADGLDFEAFLQLGIDAFHWLNRADENLRREIFAGRLEYDPEMEDALRALYRLWLRPCADAEKWIDREAKRGCKIANAELFRMCFQEVQAIVNENNEVSGALAIIRDQAIEAHRSGDTTCWEAGESSQPAVQ